jgi:hypothetical protein
MIKKLLFCLPVLFILLSSAQAQKPGPAVAATKTNHTLPLLFAENKGQVTDNSGKMRQDILFTTTSGAARVFLTAAGIQYQFSEANADEPGTIKTHAFTLTLKGANVNPKIRREEKNVFTQHFYTGHMPQEGVTNVATYGRIVYENVYPGIDWIVYSRNEQLKYDFIVHPGADASLIRMEIRDAAKVTITEKGELLMMTSLGIVKEQAPQSFADGAEVPSRFVQYEDGAIGFEVKVIPGATLVIDPAVTWSTYYGGSGIEDASGLAVDATGNVYISGITTSAAGIAMPGGFQTAIAATQDNFIVKFSGAGTPLWASYYGSFNTAVPGGNAESGGACAVDNSGNVYLLGGTSLAPMSGNLTTAGAYQTTPGGSYDAYLVKFNATGVRQWATYFGGPGSENTYGCITDATGNIYISGTTQSTSGVASTGAFQTVYGGGTSDLFLAKFNTSGTFQWATYIGGPDNEGANNNGVNNFHNCAVDNSGNIIVSSATGSASGIASPGAQQTALNGTVDAFVAKFSPAGARLWSTYFGGNDQEGPLGVSVATDATGNIYMCGDTYSSTGVATPGAYQTVFGGIGDNFLVKYNSAGVRLWSTYQGGTDYEFPGTISVNAAGSIYLAAATYSNNSLTGLGGFQFVNLGGAEGTIYKFTSAGTLQWASYFGGPGTDVITANAPFGQDLFILGKTQSVSGIATTGAFKTTLTGTANDAFVARINDIPACIPDSVMVTQTICSNQLPYNWFGDIVTTGGVNVADDTLTNIAGCDSIRHLTLIVKPVVTFTVHDTACRNEFPFLWNSISVAAPAGNMAIATYTATAANGCDSITTLNLFVRDTSATIDTKTYCRNALPAVWNSITIPVTANSNPNYTSVTLTNAGGCDSVVRLNLIVRDTYAVAVKDTTCRNDLPLVWNGITINNPAGNATTAIYNGTSVYGCDSVVTLQLYVKDTSAHTVSMTRCSNQMPFVWNGINVTAGGPNAATFITPNTAGCDSVVRLNLTVNNTTAYTQLMTKCSNQLPFVWNGINVTAGGPSAATFTTLNSAGCDSVVTLNLTVNNTSAYTDYDTVCASQLPYTWNGISVTAGGSNAASLTLTNVAGCDSVVTLNLMVNPTVIPAISIIVSPGSTVPLGTPVTFTATITNGGTTPVLQWKKNGLNVGTNSASYTDFSIDSADVVTCTLSSNAPCAFPDSAVSNAIQMSVITPPPPCLVPLTLISTDIQFSTALFKWAKVANAVGYEVALDMLPTDPSSGMFTTDTVYQASALIPGVHYFHIRTRCANGDLSPWIKIRITILNPTGINDPEANMGGLSLYPNPNNGIFNVLGTVSENKAHIDIVDKIGRVVYQGEASTPGGKLDHRVNLSGDMADGIYLLRVSSGDQVTVIRFVHN